MNRIEQLAATETFVKKNLSNYDSGHDWWHIVRVRNMTSYINEREQLADPFTAEIAALLHDTADSKFAGADNGQGYLMISDFMMNQGMSEIHDHVLNVIKNVSFSSKSQELKNDPLLRLIQDADRLDAIGAIGIARAFNYGGFRNNVIYNPDVKFSPDNDNTAPGKGSSSTIDHFYVKLLRLKDLLHTATARKLAIERHEFLEIFLRQFYREWESVT
jgi:uncharacterized protein